MILLSTPGVPFDTSSSELSNSLPQLGHTIRRVADFVFLTQSAGSIPDHFAMVSILRVRGVISRHTPEGSLLELYHGREGFQYGGSR